MPKSGYKKMFEDLEAYYPKTEDLDDLATIMSGRAKYPDAEKVVAFTEESVMPAIPPIPAGYTYLGQFISHDISFDERSDRHVREDFPWNIMSPELIGELRNLRNPTFDLESIYGHIVPTNRGEVSRAQLFLEKESLPLLKLGNTGGFDPHLPTARQIFPNDLARGDVCVTARIVDPRNDENLLLAQTQVAFTKFHNAMVVELSKKGAYTYKELFEKARKLTIRYYQTIVLKDFLPRIVQKSAIDAALARKRNFGGSYYQPDLFMPLEFSVAAFRFAHSMIRNEYNLNKNNPAADLEDLMMFTGRGEMPTSSGKSRLKLPSFWIINWNSFYKINNSVPNMAEAINTEMAERLLSLTSRPEHNAETGGRVSSLATLDLYRGRRFGLPAGQDVALKIGAKGLCAEEIERVIMSIKPANEYHDIKRRVGEAFGKKTPLWFYILAEAQIQAEKEIQAGKGFENAGKLGDVGSTITAETIIQLLNNSEYSILQHDWESGENFLLKHDGTFDMPEMLGFIQRTCEKYYQELYPGSFYPKTKSKFDELDPLEKGYQGKN